ncbi:MAG: dipicolinate synthase subunit B [Clostridiales bacterium]|nr:dipicolinate synthase subunit B [Clostridiales bacterium]MCF8022198.1 dipicolinate synthase subunit B [Clostridiales bacterium]
MRFKNLTIGFALTGSHCTINEVMPHLDNLKKEGAEIYPIISESLDKTDTRFGSAGEWKNAIEKITQKSLIKTVVDAEPIGPQKMLDVLVIAPCTGNTLAKITQAITDGPVLMAVKSQLRNKRPVVLAVSTNDGLSFNAKNLGLLLNIKNIYMVPFGQDNPTGKPNSLKSKMDLMPDTIEWALEGRQKQPVLQSF